MKYSQSITKFNGDKCILYYKLWATDAFICLKTVQKQLDNLCLGIVKELPTIFHLQKNQPRFSRFIIKIVNFEIQSIFFS